MKEYLMTLLLAMSPIIELRAAIPAGVAAGLSIKTAFFISVLGNMIPIPFILLFTRGIIHWMENHSLTMKKLADKLERKINSKKHTVEKYEFLGLVLLVAVPLPGTGAWTGAMVAAILDMRLKRALPSIFIGVIIAGIIVSYLTYGATLL